MLHFSSLFTLAFAFCVFIMQQATAGPVLHRPVVDAEWESGNFEGDMILTADQYQALHSIVQGRNGLVAQSKRWPNNTVFYKISGNFDSVHRQAIHECIAIIESRTCVRFQEANASTAYYVQITSEPGGCYTAVGYLAEVQQMNLEKYPLNEGCFRVGTILHEFMHALGFYHQQSDAHRDDYVQVMYANIKPGKEFNFEKYKSSLVTDFDVGYDYESCLHYGPNAFSANGKATLRPLNPNTQIGQRSSLSEKDVAKINIMYKCPIFI